MSPYANWESNRDIIHLYCTLSFVVNNYRPLSVEQMQIISREIKMLKTKVHKWDFLNLWKYEQSSSLLQCLFVAMFCRKAYWRMPMIYSKKGYYTLTHIHFKETVLFEMLPLDFRIAFRLVLAFRLDQSMIKKGIVHRSGRQSYCRCVIFYSHKRTYLLIKGTFAYDSGMQVGQAIHPP